MSEEQKKETMEDYAKELEASFRVIREGDIIAGKVIAVNEEEAMLDLEYYAPGIIKAEDMSNDPHFSILEEVQVGDTIEATVMKTDDGEGNIKLSKKEATLVLAWDILKAYMDDEKTIKVKISEIVKGGAVAYAEGVRGFIPASQLSLLYVEELDPWLGKELYVRVITLDQEKDKLVMSAKVIEKELAQEEMNHRISMIAPGNILEGTVESLMPYGAFVNLQGGMSGLVHISQICQKRIKKPSEVLAIGDKVKVKVLSTDNHKISLSIKAVEEDMSVDEMDEKEAFEYSSGEEVTTTLGNLFSNIKFD